MQYPNICVVIPARNAQQTLGSALDSVASQTLSQSEIIVVDDASTGPNRQIARRYRKRAFRLITCRPMWERRAARNRGVREASAELIAFLDADDEWLPRKLEKQAAL